MSHVHIHAPQPPNVSCVVLTCPTCERPRRFLARHYEWYGWMHRCAGCGDTWADGERLERPFAPGWRRKSIEYARAELAKIGVQA